MFTSSTRMRCFAAPVALKSRSEALHQRASRNRRGSTTRHAKGEDAPDGSSSEVESLFAKELAKRGISSSSVDDDGAALESSGRSVPPPQLAQQKAAPSDTPQLEKSRALNSEGLEGLIPRASELIRLGGGFFLGFVPFILLVSMLFVGMYVGFGDQFIHTGSPSTTLPEYVDPYDLLNEPTVDPYYPINN